MAERGASVLLPRPPAGRIVTTSRTVRLGDVAPTGRLRLDAVARYLQDVARDDSAGAELDNAMGWVVRRTMVEVRWAPVLEEPIELATWCSGYGGRWAERRTEIRGERGAQVDAVSLWVHVDPETGRPRRLTDQFHDVWGEAAAGRTVSARGLLDANPPPGAVAVGFPVRAVDLDILGHVNNSVHWAAVEEAMAMAGLSGRLCAELEYVSEIRAEHQTRLYVAEAAGVVESWLTADGSTASVARVCPLAR